MHANPVVRESNMRNVRRRARHVTIHTVVVQRSALRERSVAISGSVTSHALGSPFDRVRFECLRMVRIVACRAGERFALLVTPAEMELLDMPGDGHFVLIRVGNTIVKPVVRQRQSRTVVFGNLSAQH